MRGDAYEIVPVPSMPVRLPLKHNIIHIKVPDGEHKVDSHCKAMNLAGSILRIQVSRLTPAVLICTVILCMNSTSCRDASHRACGENPEIERLLMLGASARMGIDSIGIIAPEPFGGKLVELRAAYPMGKQSVIYAKIGSATGDGMQITSQTFYQSTDHGDSWQPLARPLAHNSNLAVLRGPLYALDPQDSRNPSILYANELSKGCCFKISRDAGDTWLEIRPDVITAGKPSRFQIIGSYKNGKRIYARIGSEGDSEEACLYRSVDGGKTFSLLSCDVTRAVETRANEKVMIGYLSSRMRPNSGLAVSNDGGYVWHRIDSNVLTARLFSYAPNDEAAIYRTWSEQRDQTFEAGTAILQIETDPADVNTFYVVTFKGMYATRDRGKTFRLLPLATEWLMGIDTMAVDPLDGRYLYASVNLSMLYRSADWGCSWKKLKLPE